MREITKNKNGVLYSNGAMIICPLMSSPDEDVGCLSHCAFYSETSDSFLEKHPEYPKYAYCNSNGDTEDRLITIGQFPRKNPVSTNAAAK